MELKPKLTKQFDAIDAAKSDTDIVGEKLCRPESNLQASHYAYKIAEGLINNTDLSSSRSVSEWLPVHSYGDEGVVQVRVARTNHTEYWEGLSSRTQGRDVRFDLRVVHKTGAFASPVDLDVLVITDEGVVKDQIHGEIEPGSAEWQEYDELFTSVEAAFAAVSTTDH